MQDRRDDVSGDGEDGDSSQAVSIEFLLASGETFTVQDFIDGDASDEAIKRLGEQLAAEMGSGRIRTFPYWEGEEFFFDAVRMDQVSAFSISLAEVEEEEGE
jgi:hypothetical protein